MAQDLTHIRTKVKAPFFPFRLFFPLDPSTVLCFGFWFDRGDRGFISFLFLFITYHIVVLSVLVLAVHHQHRFDSKLGVFGQFGVLTGDSCPKKPHSCSLCESKSVLPIYYSREQTLS